MERLKRWKFKSSDAGESTVTFYFKMMCEVLSRRVLRTAFVAFMVLLILLAVGAYYDKIKSVPILNQLRSAAGKILFNN